MRTILLSAANHLMPALALLVLMGSVLYQAAAFIQPPPSELIAFMAGAFAAAIVSVAFCTLGCNTTPLQESPHD